MLVEQEGVLGYFSLTTASVLRADSPRKMVAGYLPTRRRCPALPRLRTLTRFHRVGEFAEPPPARQHRTVRHLRS